MESLVLREEEKKPIRGAKGNLGTNSGLELVVWREMLG